MWVACRSVGGMSNPVSSHNAQELLRLIAGPSAILRDDQWRAIDELVNHHKRLLVVQRTGWGKSAVYFIAAKLLRDQGYGPTLIISPLLSLMRNQVQAAANAGIRAATINSSNISEWEETEAAIRSGQVDVLLISPERLVNPDFREKILLYLIVGLGMVVVDEAHCISDWGHDFRPDYRRIQELLNSDLDPNTPVLATTATANDRVVADVVSQLGPDTGVIRGGLDRTSLHLSVVHLDDPTARAAWIAGILPHLQGSGIIYCLTVSAAEDLATALRATGLEVEAYTGRTDADDRLEREQQLLNNEVKALVATSALGMGFDKPDLGFIIHLGAPSSPVSYYQQVGRAGRGTDRADVILLPGPEDRAIWDYFASTAMPSREVVESLLSALSDTPLSTAKLETAVDLSRSRIEQTLKVLAVDGAVKRVAGGWVSTGADWDYDDKRYAGIAASREREQQAMLDYENTTACRMVFLRQQLDDPTIAPGERCGRCDNCTGTHYPTAVGKTDVSATVEASLNAPGIDIQQRKRWPTGCVRSGKITGTAPGKALGRMNDITRGPALRALFADPTWVPNPTWQQDTWLSSFVRVLAAWDWQQRPRTIVVLEPEEPRRREMLLACGRALATIGQMDVGGVVTTRTAPVTAMNSTLRVNALDAHYDYSHVQIPDPSSPVLLLTDVVDTGWSVTVAGSDIAERFGTTVLPLAFATAF